MENDGKLNWDIEMAEVVIDVLEGTDQDRMLLDGAMKAWLWPLGEDGVVG